MCNVSPQRKPSDTNCGVIACVVKVTTDPARTQGAETTWSLMQTVALRHLHEEGEILHDLGQELSPRPVTTTSTGLDCASAWGAISRHPRSCVRREPEQKDPSQSTPHRCERFCPPCDMPPNIDGGARPPSQYDRNVRMKSVHLFSP